MDADADTALDVPEFYSLYRGALSLTSETRRLRALYLLLVAGRLGLRPDEVLHLHEGWVDWGRGEITIPVREPCACSECWLAVRDGDDETTLEERVYRRRWQPPSKRGPRVVPFGWSERTTAVLAAFFDEETVFTMSRNQLSELLTDVAGNAKGLDPNRTDLELLSATGAAFLANLGVDRRELEGLLGDPDVAQTYAQRYGRALTERVHGLAGSEDAWVRDDPAGRFPIACGTVPFGSEPFDLTEGRRDARVERADEQASDPQPRRNPRPTKPPHGTDYDPEQHRPPKPYDPVSSLVQTTEDGAIAATRIDAWMQRVEDDRTESTADELESGSTSRATPADGGQSAPARRAETERQSETDALRDRVTEPIVAGFTTRVAGARFGSDDARDARVLLGQEELLIAPADDASQDPLLLPLTEVADVALDHVPDGLEHALETTVGIAYDAGDDRRIVVVELPGRKRRDFTTALFRMVLNVTAVLATHPARVGGRVTDEEPTAMLMRVRPGHVEFTDKAGEETQFIIRLDDIIHVDRGKQFLGETPVRVITVRHVEDNRPVTSTVGTDDPRTLRLFERFVESEYRETLADVRDIDLSSDEEEVLVSLYSSDRSVQIYDVVDADADELSSMLETLESKGLVRSSDDGASLTGKGQLAVSDRVDSVN